MRMVGKALYLPFVVGRHRQAADGSVAGHRQGDELVVALVHLAHHQAAHHEAPQRRADQRAGAVVLVRGLHGPARRDGKGANHAVSCGSAHDVVAHAHAGVREVDDLFVHV